MSEFSPDNLWPFFTELALLAARETLPNFRATQAVHNKGDAAEFDPVTETDRRTEKILRAAIAARFPAHGIRGEEGDDVVGSSAWCWIIDPIDGTRSYICGMPTWGTLVGLLHHNAPCFGMMSQPFVGDCFIGGGGRAELIRAESTTHLRCRGDRTVASATLFSTTPEMFAAGTELNAFNRLARAVQLTRFGADCYGYSLLAAGFIDLVVEADLGYYDIAPLIPIVESAGGVVSDWEGRPLRSGGRAIAAASPALLNEALDVLNQAL